MINTDLSDLFGPEPPEPEKLHVKPATGPLLSAAPSPYPNPGPIISGPLIERETISEAALADLIGVSESRVRALAADRVLERVAPATYNRREAVRAYCASLREVATRMGGTRGNPTPENAAIKAKNLKIAKQKAIKLELENRSKKGDLIPMVDVKREWVTLAIDLRTAIMAIPARITMQLGLNREAQATLESELRLTLEEIADHGK